MIEVALAGPGALAERIALQPEVWIAIAFRADALDSGLARLIEECHSLDECEGQEVLQVDATPLVRLLDQAQHAARETIFFVRKVEELSVAQLRELDRVRNQLFGRTVVFATTETGIENLSTYSPNVYSWIGGQCFAFDPTEGVMDVELRLNSLRSHFELSDEEVIDRAKRNALPSNPAFVEWLTLLGRGDLLGA